MAQERALMAEVKNKLADEAPKRTFYSLYGKRAIDIILSSVAIIACSPLLLIISVVVIADVGKPILFKMQRPGKDEKLFTIYKFHDLNNAVDENGNLLPAEQRVTKIGKFLRGSSLDELPQLFNIFKGDMSFIGPRPLLPEYLSRYSPRQRMRQLVRPGLECPSLVNRDHPRSWEEQFEDDVWYVENLSFAVDVKMLMKLAKMVFDRQDAKRRGAADRGFFGGITAEEADRINQGYKKYL